MNFESHLTLFEKIFSDFKNICKDKVFYLSIISIMWFKVNSFTYKITIYNST